MAGTVSVNFAGFFCRRAETRREMTLHLKILQT